MTRSGVSRPIPDGLAQNRSADELEAGAVRGRLENRTHRPPELEARLFETFEVELHVARRNFETVPDSLQAAVAVDARLARVFGTTAPALVWQFVEPPLACTLGQ